MKMLFVTNHDWKTMNAPVSGSWNDAEKRYADLQLRFTELGKKKNVCNRLKVCFRSYLTVVALITGKHFFVLIL